MGFLQEGSQARTEESGVGKPNGKDESLPPPPRELELKVPKLNNPNESYNFGLSAYSDKNYARATRALLEVPEAHEKFGDARYLLGQISLQQGKHKEAVQYFEQALKEPKETATYIADAQYFLVAAAQGAEDSNLEKHIDTFLKENQEHLGRENALSWLGDMHRAAGETDKAIAAYRQAIKEFPKGVTTPANIEYIAGLEFDSKDYTAAIVQYSKLAQILTGVDRLEAQIDLVASYNKNGDYTEALTAIVEAEASAKGLGESVEKRHTAALDHSYCFACVHLARAASEPAEAFKHYDKAIERGAPEQLVEVATKERATLELRETLSQFKAAGALENGEEKLAAYGNVSKIAQALNGADSSLNPQDVEVARVLLVRSELILAKEGPKAKAGEHLAAAKKAYEAISESSPYKSETGFMLAQRQYYTAKDYKAAQATLESIEKRESKKTEAPAVLIRAKSLLAWSHYSQGHFSEALRLSQGVNHQLASAAAFDLALEQSKGNNHREAALAFATSIAAANQMETAPAYLEDARVLHVQSLQLSDQHAETVVAYQSLAKDLPKSEKLYIAAESAGLSQLEIGKTELTAANPDQKKVTAALQSALELFSQVAKDPKQQESVVEVRNRLNIADVLLVAGKKAEAREHYDYVAKTFKLEGEELKEYAKRVSDGLKVTAEK